MLWGLIGMMGKMKMPDAASALPGRQERMPVPAAHHVNGHPLEPPYPDGMEKTVFGLGCFWGAERCFWQLDGVYHDGGGLRRGSYAEPHLRGSVHRQDRGTTRWCWWCSIPRW